MSRAVYRGLHFGCAAFESTRVRCDDLSRNAFVKLCIGLFDRTRINSSGYA
jgi:hypothetical protein